MYGVRQFRAGRRVGAKSNVNDVSSPYAQAGKDIRLGRPDHFDREDNAWKEILLEDRHAGPAETAAARIDFREWLQTLPTRQRRIAEVLATGESTAVTARRFGISPSLDSIGGVPYNPNAPDKPDYCRAASLWGCSSVGRAHVWQT